MEFLCIMVVVFQQCRLSKKMRNWLKNNNFNLISRFSRTVFDKLFHLHLYFQHFSKLSFRSARHVIEIHEQDCTFIRENFTISFLLSLVECGTHHDHKRCMTQRISFIIALTLVKWSTLFPCHQISCRWWCYFVAVATSNKTVKNISICVE